MWGEAELRKIEDLIVVKDVGETTLSLLREIKFRPQETVKNYIFTDSIREHFERIFDSVIGARGGGFWVQAEYGAGKTHFIATLSCLLMDGSESLWSLVQDPEIRNYRFKMASTKLFPVMINLRGEGSVEKEEESLLRIMERHIQETVEEKGMKDKVSIATADEMIDWYNNCSLETRNAVDFFIKQTGGDPKKALRGQLAKYISSYCEKENMTPKISATTKDRLKSIYDQLLKNGYNGMLFVIDEFATRQMRHPEQSKEYAADEEVLETIAWVLPKDLRFNVYMVVASHLPAPTKLKEDRFKTINLLADKTSREYDIIAAQRIREVVKARLPEIEQYYQFYFKRFSFLKKLDKEYFFSVFPFHPQCFEAIRNITKRELPTERAGINILHDVLSNDSILEKEALITVSDLMVGLRPRELETVAYLKSYRSYRAAMDGLKDIELDAEDVAITQKAVDALFLWSLAYLDQNKCLPIQELAEMELVHDDIVKGSDLIEAVMIKLRDLPQIEYTKEKGAVFRVTGEQAVRPSEEFAKIKRKCAEQVFKIADCWEKSLVFSPEQTGGRSALFPGYSFDQRNRIAISFQKIEYLGEIVVSRDWRPEYGETLREDVHFRLVFLSRNVKLEPRVLKDKRIGVCILSALDESAQQAALNYLAITEMENAYASKNEPEAEEIRQWIDGKKRGYINALLDSQLALFVNGKICTQQSLAMDEKRVFASESLDRIFAALVNSLLSNAYQNPLVDSSSFKKNFSANDAKKVFDGFFRKDPAPASLSACENFAPGLGLSKAASPKAFSPEANAVFGYFKKRLEEDNYDVPVWKMYQELSAPPYGLIWDIITLNLLCFVRHGDPSVEIRLKDGHRQPIRGSRITSFNVPEVEWRGKFEEDFDLLSRSTEVGWNDVLPLARIVAPEQELKTATKPEDITEQERRILLSFKATIDKIPSVSRSLDALWAAFGQKFLGSDCIKNMEEICSSKNYVEFQEAVTNIYSGDRKALEADTTSFWSLAKLSDQATIILSMRSYLDQTELPTDNKRFSSAKAAIQNQLDLDLFAKDLSKLDRITKQFEDFKEEYMPLYQIHHREYYEDLNGARRQLEQAEARLETILRLNRLNMNLAPNKTAYSDLLQKTQPCVAKDPVDASSAPICKKCKISLKDKFDDQAIKTFVNGIDGSIELGMTGLKQMLTKPVLDMDKERKLGQLIKALDSKDVKLFVASLSDPLVEYLRGLFEKANIETVTLSISDFLKKHSFVEEDQIENVAKAFRSELVSAIEKAKKQRPGKKIRIALGE